MSDTCCPSTAPKVNVEVDYTPKGSYETYAGLKACTLFPPPIPTPSQFSIDRLEFQTNHTPTTDVTGPKDASKGLFVVYDIFGYFPQTLQGADILSKQLNAVVVMPDFFEGEPCSPALFPPDTEEKKAGFQKFWTTKADFEKTQATIKRVFAAIKEEHKSTTRWAIMGYCWGGKVRQIFFPELREIMRRDH